MRISGEKILDGITGSILFSTKVFVEGVEIDSSRVSLIYVWSSGACEQLEAIAKSSIVACKHPVESVMTCGNCHVWCSECGAIKRTNNGMDRWEIPGRPKASSPIASSFPPCGGRCCVTPALSVTDTAA